MKTAYIQSIGGASGDMLLGALIDSGLPLSALQEALSGLSIGSFQLTTSTETRCEVRGIKLKVSLPEDRKFSPESFRNIVTEAGLPDPVKAQSLQVLENLWRAESRVHGEDPDGIELEELGTADTIIDIVGFAFGLHYLGIAGAFASPLVLGASTPPRWPGGYSNPAPATLELAAMANASVGPELPLHQGSGELTTPTGAAIITSLASFRRPAMNVEAVGVGLGSKDPEAFPNIVRIWIGETDDDRQPESLVAIRQQGIVLLETNLDDATGETLGYAQERLFALGALDVWITPVYMKKNRPGVVLSALVPETMENDGVELILRETPTLGVRSRPVERYVAQRDTVALETSLGTVRLKLKRLTGKVVEASPEYEDCRSIALQTGKSLQEVYRLAEDAASKKFLD